MSFLHQGPGKQNLKILLPKPLRQTPEVPVFDGLLPTHLHYIQKDLSCEGARVKYIGNEDKTCKTQRRKLAWALKILKT